jgi:hypothetical protein
MTHKKKVMIMKKMEKIRKQHSLSSKFIITAGFWMAMAGLIYATGTSLSIVAGVYLGYRALRLVLRLFGLVIAAVLTAVSIFIVIIIVLLLIF